MSTRSISIGFIAITFIVSLLAIPAAGMRALAATTNTFSGQATALSGKVAGLTLPCLEGPANCSGVVDTGPFANAQQISESRSLICYDVSTQDCLVTPPNVTGSALSAGVLNATVVASGDTSSAEASVATFSLNVAGQHIGADILQARASATCTNNGAVVSAGAETSVTINGQTYTVISGQTQTIPLPANIGVVIINEGASGPHSGSSIDASALHIVIPVANTDLTVAKVHADVMCATPLGCPSDHLFVTGGGFFNNAGAKAHFAVAGGKAKAWGHVLYKPTGLQVKDPNAVLFFANGMQLSKVIATLQMSYPEFRSAIAALQTLPDTTQIEGGAILRWSPTSSTVSGAPATGKALALDLGEPGRSDYFEIADTGASAPRSLGGGFLAGGNIQMHGKC